VPKIFISHSSKNNAAALAITAWLDENGWGDYFLDVNPDRGLAPGARWQEALKLAADRCEAVLFLISPAWRDSKWCLAEFLLAKQLGKTIFGVLVEPTPLDSLPAEMTSEWQLCDLVTGEERRIFRVRVEPAVVESEFHFSETGLGRLKIGLKKAGLDASTFPWPPPHDPDRAPYRGLKALEAEDASIFFGREAAITRGLDALRRIRERGVDGMFVILGASGAGKSSFLRAGLWPRLTRDDRQFLPLPVLRPQGAVITGPAGLLNSMSIAFREGKIARTRAYLRGVLSSPEGLLQLISELQMSAEQRFGLESSPPTVLLAVDQCEELFAGDGREESDAFLRLLSSVLAKVPLQLIAVVAIRSDAYDRLQSDPRLAAITQVPFNLSPIPHAEFKTIIEGPAGRSIAAGKKLTVDPTLVERLLEDAQGADALPLLAFALERLFIDYGADGQLSGADYEELGGVRGSIEAAVEAALANPARPPVITPDRVDQEILLRQAFIPWLAGIDPDTDKPRRRIADWEQIPAGAHGIVERLIDARLLVRDRRTVEVAHEALLRQWPILTGWLGEDADTLKSIAAVQRAAAEWIEKGCGEAWLVHTGERLAAAEKALERPDVRALLGRQEFDYLTACRARDEAALATRVAYEKEIRDQADRATRAAAQADFDLANLLLDQSEKNLTAAAAHLARALRTRPDDRRVADRLVNLLAGRPWVQRIGRSMQHDGDIRSAAFSRDGFKVVTASFDGRAQVWDALTGKAVGKPIDSNYPLISAAFSGDGTRIVTLSFLGEARIWHTAERDPVLSWVAAGEGVKSASFSQDGTRVLAAFDSEARLWDAGGSLIRQFTIGEGFSEAVFSPDSTRILTASSDGSARCWDARTGYPIGENIRYVEEPGGDSNVMFDVISMLQSTAMLFEQSPIPRIVFSPDGSRAVIASGPQARLVDVVKLAPIGNPVYHEERPVFNITSVAFSPDGRTFATAAWDGSAQRWDAATGEKIGVALKHENVVRSVCFSPDARRILTSSADNTARIWDAETGSRLGEPILLEDALVSAAFDGRGTAILTAAGRRAQLWNATRGSLPLNGTEVFGQHIVRSWDGRTVELWSAPEGSALAVALRETGGADLSFSRDRKYVISIAGETPRIWDASTGENLCELTGHTDRIDSAAFSPDGSRIVTASLDNTARLWRFPGGRPAAEPLEHPAGVASATFSPDGSRLVTATQSFAQLWDAGTGKLLGERMRHGRGWVHSAVFTPSGDQVVTGSADETARVWDAFTGRPLGAPMRHRAAIRCVAISNDGKTIVTASDDGTARQWDAASGVPLGNVMQHNAEVWCAAFSPDGRRIVTASRDGTARIWDAATCEAVGEPMRHDYGVDSAHFNAAGDCVNSLARQGGLTTTWRWDVPCLPPAPSWFPIWVEVIAGRRFDNSGVLQLIDEQALVPVDVPDDDPYGRLARWFAENGPSRAINPWSSQKVTDWIYERLARRRTEEALPVLPGDALLLAIDAEHYAGRDPAKADFEAEYATQHVSFRAEDEDEKPLRPRQAAVYFSAARAWQTLGRLDRALWAAELAARFDPAPGHLDFFEALKKA
jgi:WD40 repeat protein